MNVENVSGSMASPRKTERQTNGEPKSKRRKVEKEPEPALNQTSIKDLGGIDDILQELKSIAFAIMNPHVYTATGIAPPRGVLLFGPPGCGKT